MTVGVIGTIHQLDMLMRLEGQRVMNSFFMRVDTTVDSMEERALRILMECYLNSLIPASGSNLQIVSARGKEVAPTLGPIYEIAPEVTDVVQGASEGDTMPSHDSLTINLHTERGGRSGRGRIALPGIPEGASQGSYIPAVNPYWLAVAAFVVCMANGFMHIGDPPAPNQLSWGVMSRKIGGLKPPYTVGGFALITRAVPRNIIGTTNSRKQGRGD